MIGRYYLEVHENGHRIPVAPRQGFATLEEAIEAAKKKVDDALPRNTVHVVQDVGHAYLMGDGGEGWSGPTEGVSK